MDGYDGELWTLAFSKNLHCIKMIRNILQLSTLQCDLNTIKPYITLPDQ